ASTHASVRKAGESVRQGFHVLLMVAWLPGCAFALNRVPSLITFAVAMGAQWKQAGREANAQKKGQMVAKLTREIMVAAKLGGPDPDYNPRLYVAVEKAKKASVYKDTIERAVKKGSGQL